MLGTTETAAGEVLEASAADAVGGALVSSAVIVAHPAGEAPVGVGEPLVMAVPPCPGLVAPPDALPTGDEPFPVPAGVPLPSVPAPPYCPPPLSTVVPACIIAWRKGCTPSEMLAMTASPASTATGRSQPAPAGGITRAVRFVADWLDDCGSRSSRGHERVAGQASESAQWPRHVQWPSHVQLRARS